MRFPALQIERGIHAVNILLVQLLPEELDAFSKALEVDYLPFPQELDYIVYVWVIGKPQNIVVGYPCFLLCGQVLRQVCHGIPFYSHHTGAEQRTGGGVGIYANGMVNEIRSKSGVQYLGIFQVSCQLVHNGADHFQMSQFLSTYIRVKLEPGSKNAIISKVPGLPTEPCFRSR